LIASRFTRGAIAIFLDFLSVLNVHNKPFSDSMALFAC
jgi:hypothetical protein